MTTHKLFQPEISTKSLVYESVSGDVTGYFEIFEEGNKYKYNFTILQSCEFTIIYQTADWDNCSHGPGVATSQHQI
jgi:hypothetical protein